MKKWKKWNERRWESSGYSPIKSVDLRRYTIFVLVFLYKYRFLYKCIKQCIVSSAWNDRDWWSYPMFQVCFKWQERRSTALIKDCNPWKYRNTKKTDKKLNCATSANCIEDSRWFEECGRPKSQKSEMSNKSRWDEAFHWQIHFSIFCWTRIFG